MTKVAIKKAFHFLKESIRSVEWLRDLLDVFFGLKTFVFAQLLSKSDKDAPGLPNALHKVLCCFFGSLV